MELNHNYNINETRMYNSSLANKVFTPLGYNINSIEIEDLDFANQLAQNYTPKIPTSQKIPILKKLEKLLQ